MSNVDFIRHIFNLPLYCFSACHSVIHPAALNLTQTLSLHTPATPLHLPRPPTGVLSPVLDSFRIKWEDVPLEYHSIKGNLLAATLMTSQSVLIRGIASFLG